MPEGKPNNQTIATEKYQKKAGYVSKSYKLKKDLVDRFADACEKNQVSQASTITKLMESYIESTKKE